MVTKNSFQNKKICLSTICLQNRTYCDAKLHIPKDLLTDVIVGQYILRLRDHVRFRFGSPRPLLRINVLKRIKTNILPRLLEPLSKRLQNNNHQVAQAFFGKRKIYC